MHIWSLPPLDSKMLTSVNLPQQLHFLKHLPLLHYPHTICCSQDNDLNRQRCKRKTVPLIGTWVNVRCEDHSDLLTLDIWGSSVPTSLEDHLRHQTVPEVQQLQAGVI